MNPYASYLGSRNALETVAQTPERIASLASSIGEKRMNAGAGQVERAGDCLAHLADCELVFAFRLRQTVAENNPHLQPFDQEKWARPMGHTTRPPRWRPFPRYAAGTWRSCKL